jgi:hypothetical protein
MSDSQNRMSKGDSPEDFNADDVVDYLKTADDEEKRRVAQEEENGKKRSSVLRAAEVEGSSDGSDDDDSDEGNGDDPNPTPTEETTSNEGDNVSDAHEAQQKAAEEGSEDYNPYNDPYVPSTVIADQIQKEIAAGGDTPTLDAVNEQREADKDDEEQE